MIESAMKLFEIRYAFVLGWGGAVRSLQSDGHRPPLSNLIDFHGADNNVIAGANITHGK